MKNCRIGNDFMKKHIAYQVNKDAYEYYVDKLKPSDFKMLWIEGDHLENKKEWFRNYYREMQIKNKEYFDASQEGLCTRKKI